MKDKFITGKCLYIYSELGDSFSFFNAQEKNSQKKNRYWLSPYVNLHKRWPMCFKLIKRL